MTALDKSQIHSKQQRQPHDLESEVYFHIEQAGRRGSEELETEISLGQAQTKSWHIRKAAEAAEIAGWPKKEIATRLWHIVEKHDYNITRRLIQIVCRPLGYVDDSMAHSRKHKVEETIPPKNNSSQYLDANTPVVNLVDRITVFLDDFRARMHSEPFLEILNKENPRIWPEHEYTISRLLKTAGECIDGRWTVPVVAQHMLMTMLAAESVAFVARQFQTRIKSLSLTPKQATKYKHGEVRELLPIYEPKSREDAILVGFYGIRCPRCRLWRVKPSKEGCGIALMLHCFPCGAEFAAGAGLRLPATRGVELQLEQTAEQVRDWKRRNGICPECASAMSETREGYSCKCGLAVAKPGGSA